jgi:hypothetical protein
MDLKGHDFSRADPSAQYKYALPFRREGETFPPEWKPEGVGAV